MTKVNWVRWKDGSRELVWLLGMCGESYKQLNERAYRIAMIVKHPPCPHCGKPQ